MAFIHMLPPQHIIDTHRAINHVWQTMQHAPCTDDLAYGMCAGRLPLDLNGQDAEQQDLWGVRAYLRIRQLANMNIAL